MFACCANLTKSNSSIIFIGAAFEMTDQGFNVFFFAKYEMEIIDSNVNLGTPEDKKE